MNTSHSRHTLSSLFAHLQEHVAAFVIALFFVGAVTGIVFYRDQLFADISHPLDTKQTSMVSQLPLVYEMKEGALHIISTKTFDTPVSVTFFVVFDPAHVLLRAENATSPYEYTYAPSMETMIQVTLLPQTSIPANTTVYILPVDGSIDQVTISNAGVLRKSGTYETLAIQKR